MDLFDEWRKTAAAFGPLTALIDVASGRQWTFYGLAAELEALPPAPAGQPLAVSAAGGPAFVLETLRAWRDRVPLVPLDSGGRLPDRLDGLPEWCVHVKSTSGSTGEPKIILFRPEQVAADAESIVRTMGITPAMTNVGVVSMAHSYGFSSLVAPLLLHGVPLAIAENPLPAAVASALAMVDDSVVPAVPAMWRAWHDAGLLARAAGSIRIAISAGAPLPADLEQAVFRECGLKIHNFYGASECGGIAYDDSEVPRPDGSALVGRPMRGVRLGVAPDGCLEVRGPAVGEGYWPPGSQGGEALHGGCHRTGDLARVTGDGLELTGRAGDAINVAGRKLAPAVVEAVMERHPAVRHCVVFGVPSRNAARTDDVVIALSLREDAARLDVEQALRRHAAAELDAWQVPRRWVIDDSVGPDERGKISRRRWREMFLAGADR